MDINREKELHYQIENLRSQLEKEYEENNKLKAEADWARGSKREVEQERDEALSKIEELEDTLMWLRKEFEDYQSQYHPF